MILFVEVWRPVGFLQLCFSAGFVQCQKKGACEVLVTGQKSDSSSVISFLSFWSCHFPPNLPWRPLHDLEHHLDDYVPAFSRPCPPSTVSRRTFTPTCRNQPLFRFSALMYHSLPVERLLLRCDDAWNSLKELLRCSIKCNSTFCDKKSILHLSGLHHSLCTLNFETSLNSGPFNSLQSIVA